MQGFCLGLAHKKAPPESAGPWRGRPGRSLRGRGPQGLRAVAKAGGAWALGAESPPPSVSSKFAPRFCVGSGRPARRGREGERADRQPPPVPPPASPRAGAGARPAGRALHRLRPRGPGRAQPGTPAPPQPGLAPAARAPTASPLPWQPREPPARARPRERSAAAAAAAPAPAARAATPLRSPLVDPGPAPGPLRGPASAPAPAGRAPPWSCWPQPSAPPAPWTTTAPPRRATRATRRRDTCPAGEGARPARPPHPRAPPGPSRGRRPPAHRPPPAPSCRRPAWVGVPLGPGLPPASSPGEARFPLGAHTPAVWPWDGIEARGGPGSRAV